MGLVSGKKVILYAIGQVQVYVMSLDCVFELFFYQESLMRIFKYILLDEFKKAPFDLPLISWTSKKTFSRRWNKFHKWSRYSAVRSMQFAFDTLIE